MNEARSISSQRVIILLLIIALPIFFLLDLMLGSVKIPVSEIIQVIFGGESSKKGWDIIIIHHRLPHAFTAAFSGAALAVSGLFLQTFFRNPLAGPSILGISSGASLGVALLIMGGSAFGFNIHLLDAVGYHSFIIPAAFIGAMLVALLMILVANRIKDIISILIVGMMMGYLTSSIVSILVQRASQSSLQQFSLWGLGTFDGVSIESLSLFIFSILILLGLSLFLIKPLNLFLLGDKKANSLGLNIRSTRTKIILLSSLLAAIVTAYCGPIAFIGITVPHIMRMLLKTSDHKLLIPACILGGALICSICSIISRGVIQDSILPINAVTSLLGAPVVIWIILSQRKNR